MDCGDGACHTVPVYEGYALPYATLPHDITGAELTDHLMSLLLGSGLAFPRNSEIVRDIKEKTCYIALDFEAEVEMFRDDPSHSNISYTLPDGQV